MLFFYNFDFDLLHVETKVIKTSWTIYYNGIGTFEAHFPLSSELLKLVSENRYIVVKEGNKTAIVIGYEAKDELTVFGRTANWILSKRVAKKTDGVISNHSAFDICRHVIEMAFSDVDNFEVENFSGTDETEFEIASVITVSEAVCNCLSLNHLGHTVDFLPKEKKWVFKILKGTENPILLSEANKNACDTSMICDILELADCGYYSDGIYLSGENSGIYRWEAILKGETETEAREEIADKKINNLVSLKTKNIKLWQDYELGDVMRVQIVKGNVKTTKQKRVSGVTLVRQNENVEEIPVFEDIGGSE